MSWDKLRDELTKEESSNKNVFTKFAEGNTVLRILSNDKPFTRWTHWLPTQNVGITCLGKKDCPICALIKVAKDNGEVPKYNASKKHAIPVWNLGTNQLEIVDQGIGFLEGILDLVEERKEDGKTFEPNTFDIRVKRTGMNQTNTRYTFKDLDSDAKLTSEQQKALDEAKPISECFLNPNKAQILDLLDGKTLKEVYEDDGVDFTK